MSLGSGSQGQGRTVQPWTVSGGTPGLSALLSLGTAWPLLERGTRSQNRLCFSCSLVSVSGAASEGLL